MPLPLKGILVLEFCQYLAGPYAGLRLADLGATVVKVERPGSGDACRQLATKNLWVGKNSLLFHTINRNKSSITANLKDPNDLQRVQELIKKADVMTHNFRPGVMEKIGLDYGSVKKLNPGIIYGQVTGYGTRGPWKDKPGQDLLAQSITGLAWSTGNGDQPPTPWGIAVADMMCGTHLAQGILAALVRRKREGIGAHVEASLVESTTDLQFESITTYLNNGRQPVERSQVSNGHPLLGAPYGIYKTLDGHIAISFADLDKLAEAIEDPDMFNAEIIRDPYTCRDAAKQLIQEKLLHETTGEWISRLTSAGIWCSDVLDYNQLMEQPAYQSLDMELNLRPEDGTEITTTRCPIRIDDKLLKSSVAAPELGNANRDYLEEHEL
jgi:crotonobetainyl-CoA:carnitine CoA-transferase CaiB-like acyl-CoA transferase